MEAPTDPAILIDLLQAMVSQTTWVYAELWAPSNGRLMTEAVWWRSGKSGEGFAALEKLSRSMALKTGTGLAGRAWESGELEWSEDLTVKGSALDGSPRQAAVEASGILASLTVPVKTDEGRVVAVVVLLSQRVEPVVESKMAAAEALSASAAPFLEHMVAQREGGRAQQGAGEPKGDWGEGVSVTDSEEGGGGGGIRGLVEIKYPPPVGGKFKPVGSSAAMPGASASRHGIGGGGGGMMSHRSAASGDPRGHQRGKANSYMTQLVTALQKCNRHEEGKPDAIRTNVAWVVLEQMANDVGAYSECLRKIIDELRPAMFGDDLIAMNDGLSMVKAPFFTQLEYRMQQVRDMEAKVGEIQQECDRVSAAHMEVRAEADRLEAEQAVMLRRAFVAERKLIKIKLSTFLERRGMQIKLLEENEAEIMRMKDTINDLQIKLNVRMESATQEIVTNPDERDIFRESVRETGILQPPMKASLMEPPMQDPDVFGPFQPTLAQDDEGIEMKQQLLILRNARLTDFEEKYRTAQHDRKTFDDKEKPYFVLQMHELEEELGLLEDKVLNGWQTPRYELEDEPTASEHGASSGKAGFGNTPKSIGGTGKNLLSASMRSRGSIKSDPSDMDEQEEQDLTGEELEEQLRFYTDSKSSVINIWKGYQRRTQGKPREMPRSLPQESIITWVYEIFEEKVRLDTDSQNNKATGYMTIEKVFYTVLDEKYGSEEIANLVAYDFLSFIDANRLNVKLLNLFAAAMSGGWYDADWKYILRVQQFIKALAPQGFPNMLALDEFMVRHFYHDQPQSEIHRVLKAFTIFPTYNRQLAELGPAGEAISAELFAEFVAYLLDIQEEPRLRKVGIMIGIRDLDKPITVTYEEFESFTNMCVPLPLRVELCQLYYRMMIRAHPDQHFPPGSLAMAITAIELEVLLEHYSVEGNSLQMDGSNQLNSLSPLMASLNRPGLLIPDIRAPSSGTNTSPHLAQRITSPHTFDREGKQQPPSRGEGTRAYSLQ